MDPDSQHTGTAVSAPLAAFKLDVLHSDRYQLYAFIQRQAKLELVSDATIKKHTLTWPIPHLHTEIVELILAMQTRKHDLSH
jgi:hypothetical protein